MQRTDPFAAAEKASQGQLDEPGRQLHDEVVGSQCRHTRRFTYRDWSSAAKTEAYYMRWTCPWCLSSPPGQGPQCRTMRSCYAAYALADGGLHYSTSPAPTLGGGVMLASIKRDGVRLRVVYDAADGWEIRTKLADPKAPPSTSPADAGLLGGSTEAKGAGGGTMCDCTSSTNARHLLRKTMKTVLECLQTKVGGGGSLDGFVADLELVPARAFENPRAYATAAQVFPVITANLSIKDLQKLTGTGSKGKKALHRNLEQKNVPKHEYADVDEVWHLCVFDCVWTGGPCECVVPTACTCYTTKSFQGADLRARIATALEALKPAADELRTHRIHLSAVRQVEVTLAGKTIGEKKRQIATFCNSIFARDEHCLAEGVVFRRPTSNWSLKVKPKRAYTLAAAPVGPIAPRPDGLCQHGRHYKVHLLFPNQRVPAQWWPGDAADIGTVVMVYGYLRNPFLILPPNGPETVPPPPAPATGRENGKAIVAAYPAILDALLDPP